jgi:hypothetical protein
MTKKKSVKKKSISKKTKSLEIEKLLIENFITLQNVLANLTTEFKGLSGEISKLLALFESSAKSFAEKQGTQINKEDKAFLERLDQLINQNKIIAKGLTLMEERMRTPQQSPRPNIPQNPRQLTKS